MSARAVLKAGTDPAHRALDARFSALDLAKGDDYRAFLAAHAAALLPIEQALADAGAEALYPGWTASRRSAALVADLDALGVRIPAPIAPPGYGDAAAVMGGLYVLEGSRLGAQLLVRQVAPGAPAAFLSAPPAPGGWRGFVAALERILYDPMEQHKALRAALETFARFAGAGEQVDQ